MSDSGNMTGFGQKKKPNPKPSSTRAPRRTPRSGRSAVIASLRQSIDNVDTAIVSLLAERFKYTSQVGVLKARAGFAPADYQREHAQIERLHRIADEAGLDPEIAEMYREFVVTEAKRRHKRIAENGETRAYSTFSPEPDPFPRAPRERPLPTGMPGTTLNALGDCFDCD